jgi:hypothetical protein
MSDGTTTPTQNTAPSRSTFETVLTLLAITAQALLTVELFEPGSVAGKLVAVVGMVFTGFGGSLLRRSGAKILPVALLVLLFGAVALSSGCSWFKSTGKRAAQSYVDCMQPAAIKLAIELKPTFRDLLKNATQNDGKIDWTPVRAAASSLTTPATRCAFSTVVAEAMRAVKNAASGVMSSPLDVDKADLAAGFESIRADFYGGETYKLESGTL